MPQIPFVGPSYTLRSRNIDAQRTVNLMPVMDETGMGKTVSALVPTPGLRRFVDLGSGVVRGMITDPGSGRCFVIHGSQLTELFSDGTYAGISGLATSTGSVGMASNGRQIVIVDGDNGYVLRLEDNQFGPITAEGWQGSNSVAFLDGYFIFVKPGSQVVYISAPYTDPIEIDPLDFASAEGSPDPLLAGYALHKQLWLFGSTSLEVWYNSGNPDFPFTPINGAFIEHGLAAAYSVAVMDDTFYWLGTDPTGTGIVYAANGFSTQRISNNAVEYAIQSYANISDAVAFSYVQEGHRLYVLSFPTAQATWVFDSSTGQWHERQYLNPSSGLAERHRAQYHCVAFGKHLVSDYANSKVYELALDYYTDDGDPIARIRRSPHISGGELERIAFREFQLDIQSGVGLATGFGHNPQIQLRWSNDGGYTWSNEVSTGAGKQGEFKTRAIWRRLGQARDRVWEVTFTEPVPAVWLGARIIADQSIS